MFITLTISFTVSMVLASIITPVIMIKLMGNPKVMNWIMNYYIKTMDKVIKHFEEKEDLGA